MDTAPVPALLRTITSDPGRPRLTWYGPGGERTEQSGHVLDNWVTKTTNLLVAEHDAGPGTRVRLDLPPHWRSVVWTLAAWRAGAEVLCDDGGAGYADVVVTHRPDAYAASRPAAVLGVALPSLARALPEPVAPGVEDATSAALAYGDLLGYVPPTDLDAVALTTAGQRVRHRHLGTWWSAAAPPDAGATPRVLVTAGEESLAPVLAPVLAALDLGGSAVLCGHEVSAALTDDPARRQRLLESELVTAVV